MIALSANASPAERLVWLKENKRVILRCKHWRDIPEYVAEMKKTNAEIRKLERKASRAETPTECNAEGCHKPVAGEGLNRCLDHLKEWIGDQHNLVARLMGERERWQKRAIDAELHLNAAQAELHFAGIQIGEEIDGPALCAGIRQLRAERDALKMAANGAQRDLVDCIVGHEQTSVHAAFGEETPLGEQYGGE